MPASLVPALDPTPMPGPAWLFQLLLGATFFLHLVCVNAVVGGTVVGALALAVRPGDRGRRIASLLTGISSWAISLAITLGVAALLFVQVLYGRFVYSATILVAPAWLGMLLLLAAAYTLNHAAKRALAAGRAPLVALSVEAVLFLLISALQVAVHLLSVRPSRWRGTQASPWAVLSDPSFWPRFLHFVLAGLTMAGIVLAWLAVRRPVNGDEAAEAADRARLGVHVALGATLLQLLSGFWLLLSLPRPVLAGFMRGGGPTMGPLTVGLLAGFGLLVLLARVSDPLAQRRLVRHVVELFGAAMVVMVVTRQQVRELTLAAEGIVTSQPSASAWGPILLFLAATVLCAGLTVWTVAAFRRERHG